LDSAYGLARTANILLISGAVLTGVGATFVLIGGPSEERTPEQARLAVSPTGLGLSAHGVF
jgi:hypothetical protein